MDVVPEYFVFAGFSVKRICRIEVIMGFDIILI